MKISVELSDTQAKILERAFRRGRFQKVESTAEQLVQLAANSWIDWLSGEKRYTSLTDQYADWVEQICVSLLPEEEAPSFDRLYNSFNIPPGQAQYIERVLSNKSFTRWRERAIKELKTAMKEKLDEVDQAMKANRLDTNFEIRISKLAYLVMKSTCERLFQAKPDEIIPPIYKSSGNLFSARIAAVCFHKIYDAIE